ncbi:hypothetical protein J3R82DRAFT_7228 [Butyriboletus roseoflavus]|nr:hypothetical protein J3R82DRAFT_7228 [Butyriboletus roseoflavus]
MSLASKDETKASPLKASNSRRVIPVVSMSTYRPVCGLTINANTSSPLLPDSLLDSEVTPSNTTVTLPTPDPVRVQLASLECHNPPRFIFYPISWDGSEDPATQGRLITSPNHTPPDIHTDYVGDDQLNSPSAVFCSTDAFWSIDRWRHDVVKCGHGTANLLDPIQDADTPFPLLSSPHNHQRGLLQNTQPAIPSTRGTGSNGSEDEVRLWIHP